MLMVLATLAVVPVFSEVEVDDLFSHEQGIVLPEGTHDYYSVELSGIHYRNAQVGLDDLRVRDSRGVYCPYVLNSSRNEETSELLSYETAAIGIVTEEIDNMPVVHHDFQVVDFSDEGEINTFILESGADNFSCQVRIFARTAKSEWLPVATDTVYRLDDVEKMFVELDEVSLYQFWRITVDSPSPFASLSLIPRLDRKRSETQGFLKEIVLDFEDGTEKAGRTILTVKNPDRLRLVSLTLETPVLFKRHVTLEKGHRGPGSGNTRLASKQLYRIPSGEDLVVDTTIEPDAPWIQNESIDIIIEDLDDEPLPVERITARYKTDYLVFKPSGHPPYVLVYGNETLETPVYDLAAYKDEVLAWNPPAATLAAPVIHAVPETRNENGKTLFTVIVIVSAILLFALSLLIFLKKPGERG